MAEQITPSNSSPLLLSKSILARDSILKRLDLNKHEFGEDRTKMSHLYQQLEKKIQVT